MGDKVEKRRKKKLGSGELFRVLSFANPSGEDASLVTFYLRHRMQSFVRRPIAVGLCLCLVLCVLFSRVRLPHPFGFYCLHNESLFLENRLLA